MNRIPVAARDIRLNDVIDGATVVYVHTLRMGYTVVKVSTLTGGERTDTYEAGRKVIVRRKGTR